MSGSWLDVEGPSGTRRVPLNEGLTRLGGEGSDIRLEAPRGDELQVWNRPPRMLFLGAGARPTCAGQPFDERALRPGERIEWAGHVLVYGGEAAREHEALLEELPLAPAAPTRAATVSPAFSERVRAGLACELGLADAAAMKRWREAVLAGRFEPDACARELLPRTLGPEAEQRLLERAGSLQRDFLMAALLSGFEGARRKAREKARGLVAFLLTQLLALLVFCLLIAAALLLLRARDTSIDAFLDRFLPG